MRGPKRFREANPFQKHSKLLACESGQTLRHAIVRTSRSEERDQFAQLASVRAQRDSVKRAVRQTRGLIEESLSVAGDGLPSTGTLVRHADKDDAASNAALQQSTQLLNGIREADGVTGDLSNRRKDLFFVHKWETLVSRAKELVKQGTPKEELLAKIKPDDIGWNVNHQQWQNPQRLDPFYAELQTAE